MDSIKPLLENLTSIEGIDAAVVIGHDGFVIEAITSVDIDAEAIGGILSGGIKTTEEMGVDLSIGILIQSMIEYDKGTILSKLIADSGAILAVVANDEAVIGNVRYQLNKFSEQLKKYIE